MGLLTGERKSRMPAAVNAAGRWRRGKPAQSGRYLVEYRQGKRLRVFVMDYDFNEGWDRCGMKVHVQRYAKINSNYA